MNRKRLATGGWVALFCLAGSLELTAEQAVLSPVRDTTLYESTTGSLANGAGNYLFAGNNDENPVRIRRALLAFDVRRAVPAGSVVSNVTLSLFMSRTKGREEPVTLHRVLMDWGEGLSHAEGEEGKGAPPQSGDATWLHRFYPMANWTSPGGDFASGASASTPVNKNGTYAWSSALMAADVQAWVDNPASDFGWLLRGNEASAQTAKRFESLQATDPTRRPQLIITFRPPASTGACCFTNGNCVVTTHIECDALGGSYQGDGTSCTLNPCPQPPKIGACCLDDGTCLEVTALECSAMGGTYQGDGIACRPDLCPVILEPFVDALPVPAPIMPVEGSVGGAARYVVPITQFLQTLHRDLPPTTVWGFGGSFPGPTIEARRGLPVTVVWTNDLRDPGGQFLTEHYLPVDLCLHGPDHAGNTPRTVVHLHGGHVPPEADGYPEDAYLPGQSAEFVYPNNQPAATLWYHDHALGITRLNVYMGMAGFYLLRDDTEAALGLPSGEHEVPLAIQDRAFHPDGSLRYPVAWQEHFFGDKILVNGKVWPYFEVRQGKYRFRLLNGCTSRVLNLGLSTGDTFHQIGTDSGLLPAPVPMQGVVIASGERADVVIDFASYPAGTTVVLTNGAPAPYPGDPGVNVITNVLRFVVQAEEGHTDPLPSSLVPLTPLDEADALLSRDFLLHREDDPCTGRRWLINGLGWDDITEYPILGTTEVWNWINRSGIVHPMHMHLVLFQVLDRQAYEIENNLVVPTGPRVPPPPGERGWKDTVRANPGEITRVIARFEDYTGTYPYHCHILEHEDHEMMRQVTVVLPPRFLSVGLAGSDVRLEVSSIPSWLHRVEWSSNLDVPVWRTLSNFTPDQAGPIPVWDPGATVTQPARYYRLSVEPE